MAKVFMPGTSQNLRGWVGRGLYGRRGVAVNPYPIGRYGLNFEASQFYSHLGWCYQVRRTWHGMQNCAIRPPISAQRNTPAQQATKIAFANAVASWHLLDPGSRDIYNRRASGKKYSGYNFYLSHYLTGKPV